MPEVLVVGAGPTGLVMAYALATQGVDVHIIDQASGPGTASRAMGVQARTLEFYRQFGFGDAMAEAGIPAKTVHVRNAGGEAAQVSLAEMGGDLSPYPYMLAYPQDAHEAFLVERLAEIGVEVEWNTELASLEQSADQVVAELRRGERTQKMSCAYLCGCDGAHSATRHALEIGFDGGTYAGLFYVADTEVEGEPSMDLTVNLGSAGIGLCLPVRGGQQRLIGMVPSEHSDPPPESFETIRAPVEALIGVTVTKVNWFSTYQVHHRVADAFRRGRCFLAGDAGHIHSPAGGQGMNTGIGDAVNLAWKLAAVLQGRAQPKLLETYETERIGFARELVDTTDRAFRFMTSEGWATEFIRGWLAPKLAGVATKFSAARRKMFRLISQIRIEYRDCELGEGKAGEIHGGDRLPWTGAKGPDNYAPLRSCTWQLHVYGEPSEELATWAEGRSLDLHSFSWDEAMDDAGLAEGASYLVRPDGYVAWADKQADEGAAKGLEVYVDRWGLDFVREVAR